MQAAGLGRVDQAVRAALRPLIEAGCWAEAAAVLRLRLAEPGTNTRIVALFLEERARHRTGARLRTSDLHDGFVTWCVEQSWPALSRHAFHKAVRGLDHVTVKVHGHVFYRGLELATPAGEETWPPAARSPECPY